MAPIPRCDLRLPSETRSKRSSQRTPLRPKTTSTAVEKARSAVEEIATEEEEEAVDTDFVPEAAHSAVRRDTADTLQRVVVPEPAHSAVRKDTAETLEQDVVPEPAHSAVRRDTAESLEQVTEFSTRLTRDMVEVREHKLAEEGRRTDVCEQVARCHFKPGDKEAVIPTPPVGCKLENLGTPGDTSPKFLMDRAESPFEGVEIDTELDTPQQQLVRKPVVIKDRSMCKNTFRSTIQYESLFGSTNAMGTRKKYELEMKKKRKYYEKLYARNRIRRMKERRKALARRRAMRCCDQSKIPQTKDDIFVNKAFHFRLNYNRRLPYMPSTMDVHFQKFKKPPFKYFHKGTEICYRRVDEFEKLRQAIDAAEKPAVAVAGKKMVKQIKANA